MKLIRTKKGQNDFSLTGLTLGKLKAIEYSLARTSNEKLLGPVGEDILIFLNNQNLNTVSPEGEDF